MANWEDKLYEKMGGRIVLPRDTMAFRGFGYRPKKMSKLEALSRDIKPAEKGFMWVVGPPRRMTILQMYYLNPKAFLGKPSSHYHNCTVGANNGKEWLCVHLGYDYERLSRTWQEHQEMVSTDEYIPCIAEAIWCGLLRLQKFEYQSFALRTATRSNNNERAVACSHTGSHYVHPGLLCIHSFPDNDSGAGLGLAVVKKATAKK